MENPRHDTSAMNSAVARLVDQIKSAHDDGGKLCIVGGGTKKFYGGEPQGQPMETGDLDGIISYNPTELVVHVAAGTRLSVLKGILADAGQGLAFDPPAFGDAATVGGVVATGLSGPSRPYAGSVRDFVLGVGLINGRGEHLDFGGQVMKNVAGYDVSRLVTGSLGVLGLITDVSFKVLPIPATERTLVFNDIDRSSALGRMNEWARKPMPITATAHVNDQLYVRLAGSVKAVDASANSLTGSVESSESQFWTALRELGLPQLTESTGPLWRLSVPPAAADIDLTGNWVIDWGGAQRWLIDTDADADRIRAAAVAAGGHASEFRGAGDRSQCFESLPRVMMALHQRLKSAFDPKSVLNPGRLYSQF